MKNVLVTGGAGYLGAHTCKELSRAGYNPVVIDNLTYGHPSFVKWGPFIEGDVSDKDLLGTVIRKYAVRDIIHFAAFAYVGESVENPRKYYENNICGSLSLLGAAVDNGVSNIVFSSTCATYGAASSAPIAESSAQVPMNPYGFTKFVVENALRDYANRHQINALVFRYFNASGADPELEVGESHDPETHLIPLAIKAALDPSYTLKVFGHDYATPDGSCVRDYIHVSDLASAHVIGLHHLWQKSSPRDGLGGYFDAFNVGSNRGTSVYEIIREIENVSGFKVKYEIAQRRPGDPPALIADVSKAETVLTWKASRSSIENIIKTSLDWALKVGAKP